MKNNLYNKQMEDLKGSWVLTKPIAHRGLWNEEIIENSLKAFENAISNNYAIETDVWRIKDGTLVIYHDDDLKRLCGVDKKITDIENIEELKSYKIYGKETIPTFDELLNTVDGKTEILVEVKTYDFTGDTEKLIYERLKNYNGKFIIEGFNPSTVYWYKKNAPEIIRGQLSDYFLTDKSKGFVRMFKKLVKNLYFDKFTKPHFVAYNTKHIPNKYLEKAKKKNIYILAWTVKSNQEYERIKNEVDNIIFEKFLP